MTQRTRLETFITTWFGERRGKVEYLRAYVLEQATILEIRIDAVLTASIATGVQTANVLSEALWRLPIAVRIKMLRELLERRGLTDRWPFVVPVLQSFFDLRHTLAHGVAVKGLTPAGPDPDGVSIITVKRGRAETVTYPMERLEWLAWQARVVDEELFQVWATIVPVTKAWLEPRAEDGYALY